MESRILSIIFAGLNNFKISVKELIQRTNCIGITSKAGRYGGTYSVSFSFLEFPIWHSFWLPCQSLLSSFCAELVAAYLFEGSVLFVWCILVYGIMVWVVKLLACEARKTANTQIKEIVVAYHEFFV